MVWCYKISGVEKGVVGGKNGVLLAQSTPTFSLKSIKFWGVMGVILIIIYIYIIILYGWGWVTHFLCGKRCKCGKCYPSAFRRMPTMLIYAKIAAEYGISEDRVRKIIRSP